MIVFFKRLKISIECFLYAWRFFNSEARLKYSWRLAYESWLYRNGAFEIIDFDGKGKTVKIKKRCIKNSGPDDTYYNKNAVRYFDEVPDGYTEVDYEYLYEHVKSVWHIQENYDDEWPTIDCVKWSDGVIGIIGESEDDKDGVSHV